MRNKRIKYLLFFTLLIILFCFYGLINVMVSLKYETENPGDCISLISGNNLCQTLTIFKTIIVINSLIFLICVYFLTFTKPKNVNTPLTRRIQNITDWENVDNGKTIGTKGSESGIIISDIEIIDSARITLEKDCNDIPFAVTIGIYGLMFHTEYLSNEQIAHEYIEKRKRIINEILNLYTVEENSRDNQWNIKHDKLVDSLVEN